MRRQRPLQHAQTIDSAASAGAGADGQRRYCRFTDCARFLLAAFISVTATFQLLYSFSYDLASAEAPSSMRGSNRGGRGLQGWQLQEVATTRRHASPQQSTGLLSSLLHAFSPSSSSSSSAASLPTLADMLALHHPLELYSDWSQPLYSVALATAWFGDPHPAFVNVGRYEPGMYAPAFTCPASGCSLTLTQSPTSHYEVAPPGIHRYAHLVLYHMGIWDFTDPNVLEEIDLKQYPTAAAVDCTGMPYKRRRGEGVGPRASNRTTPDAEGDGEGEGGTEGSGGGRLYRHAALMAAETFELHQRSIPWQLFSTEASFRPSSFSRESYVQSSLGENQEQGVPVPHGPGLWSMQARVWADIWPDPLPWVDKDKAVLATWASHYCEGSYSAREDYVRALAAHGLHTLVLGHHGNCLRNASEELLAMNRSMQHGQLRRHMFHLAFENARVSGYVTEKFYGALVRGQIPVVWGAPDIARHAPGPGSYIDASHYQHDVPSLVALLRRIAADEALHATYHAWRWERGWQQYGDVLRGEIAEMVWLANASASETVRYQCRLCHGVRRFGAAGGFDAPPQAVCSTSIHTHAQGRPSAPPPVVEGAPGSSAPSTAGLGAGGSAGAGADVAGGWAGGVGLKPMELDTLPPFPSAIDSNRESAS